MRTLILLNVNDLFDLKRWKLSVAHFLGDRCPQPSSRAFRPALS